MKTARFRGNAARTYPRFLAIAMLLLFALISSALGQKSEDRDNPTPLKSKEVSDQLDGSEDEYFYQFTAGPGKLTVTFEVKAAGTNAGAYLDLFNAKSRPVLSNVLAQGVDGSSEQVVESAQISQRQTMTLRIKGIKYGSSGGQGTYRVLLDGAVSVAPAGTPETKSAESESKTDDSNQTVSFAGTWKTVIVGVGFEVRLQQVDDKVIGTYTPYNGKIEGTVTGSTVRFKWIQDGGLTGTGEFSMNKGEQSFSGSSTQDKPGAVATPWNGTRPAAFFAGVWNVASADKTSTLTLQQIANRITGSLKSASGNGVESIEDATLVGNSLSFKLKSANGQLSSGFFLMNKDGKSFTGSIGANKLTGTLVKVD